MAFRFANVDGRAALVSGDNYYDLEKVSGGRVSADPMIALNSVSQFSDITAILANEQPTGTISEAKFGAPVPRPRQSFGVGVNYRKHAEESKMQIPTIPMIFTKFPSCIAGPTATVELRSDYVDWECEMVFVIGREAKDVSEADAWSYVAGLCAGQDISDRPAQISGVSAQFNMGKSFDTFGPIGPFLVSPDSLDDPSDLALETKINGDVVQSDRTSDMIFNVPQLVSYLSHIVTLNVGDIVFTGTPAGVGMPEGKFLKDGDVITTTIEGLGTMVNPCVRVSDHPHAKDPLPKVLQAIMGQAAQI